MPVLPTGERTNLPVLWILCLNLNLQAEQEWSFLWKRMKIPPGGKMIGKKFIKQNALRRKTGGRTF